MTDIIHTTSGNNLVVDMPPIAVREDFIEIPGLGRIKATFDFSEMDPRGHETALNYIMRSGMRIATYQRTEYKVSPKKPKKSWWKRIFG